MPYLIFWGSFRKCYEDIRQRNQSFLRERDRDTSDPILADILHKLPTWVNTDHNSNSYEILLVPTPYLCVTCFSIIGSKGRPKADLYQAEGWSFEPYEFFTMCRQVCFKEKGGTKGKDGDHVVDNKVYSPLSPSLFSPSQETHYIMVFRPPVLARWVVTIYL